MRPVKTEDMYPSICVVEVHTLFHLLQNPFKDRNTRDLYGTNHFSDLYVDFVCGRRCLLQRWMIVRLYEHDFLPSLSFTKL